MLYPLLVLLECCAYLSTWISRRLSRKPSKWPIEIPEDLQYAIDGCISIYRKVLGKEPLQSDQEVQTEQGGESEQNGPTEQDDHEEQKVGDEHVPQHPWDFPRQPSDNRNRSGHDMRTFHGRSGHTSAWATFQKQHEERQPEYQRQQQEQQQREQEEQQREQEEQEKWRQEKQREHDEWYRKKEEQNQKEWEEQEEWEAEQKQKQKQREREQEQEQKQQRQQEAQEQQNQGYQQGETYEEYRTRREQWSEKSCDASENGSVNKEGSGRGNNEKSKLTSGNKEISGGRSMVMRMIRINRIVKLVRDGKISSRTTGQSTRSFGRLGALSSSQSPSRKRPRHSTRI